MQARVRCTLWLNGFAHVPQDGLRPSFLLYFATPSNQSVQQRIELARAARTPTTLADQAGAALGVAK